MIEIGFGREPRAAFAVDPWQSRGRLIPEPESPTRTAYQRDRDRIIHSTAFRRLKHKTQVFVEHTGDHYRTRLTHSIEVGQISRSLARALRLDEDLAEALALAHDLGHTPFGHTGEDALDACMADYGGFDHNAQSLRIVTLLERRYAEFDGLNLSWETLEGLVKHNGPLLDGSGRPTGPYAGQDLPYGLVAYPDWRNLGLDSYASLEAQAAAIADDIAYNAHDIDDGLRSGLITVEGLADVPLVGDQLRAIGARYPALEFPRLINELTRRIITVLVEDVIATAIRNLESLRPACADDVRGAGRPIIVFSEPIAEAVRGIRRFLFPELYRHPRVLAVRRDADRVVRDLFAAYMADPDHLPEEWRRDLPAEDRVARARRIADYIAGMTDRFAMLEHRRWFDDTPELR